MQLLAFSKNAGEMIGFASATGIGAITLKVSGGSLESRQVTLPLIS
jgi:hypothetical protein